MADKVKIYLSPSSQPENKYAVGDTNEAIQCGKIAEACAACLNSVTVEEKVEDSDSLVGVFEVKVGANTGGATMKTRVAESNEWGAHLHVPIHTNAGAGKAGGPQVYIADGADDPNKELTKLANKVLECLMQATPGKGYTGVFNNKYNFYEINQANASTIYCECEFHDCEEGASYIISNYTEIGKAIAKGICDYYKVAGDFPGNIEGVMGGIPAEPIKITTTTPEAYPDPAQNITLSTDVSLRNGNFSYSFELPKKEGFGYYYNRAEFEHESKRKCGYTTFLVINNTEIIQLDDTQTTPHEDSTTRVSGSFVLKDKLSKADLNKLKAADSIQFGVKTYVTKPDDDNTILYSYDIPHASNSICLRVNNYNIIINPYNKD